jgi:hypothetical protein
MPVNAFAVNAVCPELTDHGTVQFIICALVGAGLQEATIA